MQNQCICPAGLSPPRQGRRCGGAGAGRCRVRRPDLAHRLAGRGQHASRSPACAADRVGQQPARRLSGRDVTCLACGWAGWLSTVSRVALGGGVTPVILAVSHRLLPFLGRVPGRRCTPVGRIVRCGWLSPCPWSEVPVVTQQPGGDRQAFALFTGHVLLIQGDERFDVLAGQQQCRARFDLQQHDPQASPRRASDAP